MEVHAHGGTGMRKILSWPGLVLLPVAYLLSSCASYDMLSPAPATDTHEFLYVQTSPYIQYGDPSLSSATYGYSVSTSGQLMPLAGYPQPGNFLGVFSGKYFYTGEPDGIHLDTYLIGADGSFTKIHSVIDKAMAQCTEQCHIFADITDHTGSSLYVDGYNGRDDVERPETYSIDKNTGELTYVSPGGTHWSLYGGECSFDDFTADNRYVYGVCDGPHAPGLIEIEARNPNGSLTDVPNVRVIGPAPPPGIIYGGSPAGADAENHLAAIIFSWPSNLGPVNDSPDLLVSYTINADGSLTTTNTTADMPAVQEVTAVGGLSPSGKLFVVGTPDGIQMFNFNGAAPMTLNGSLIPTDTPAQIQWDSQNRLFVLSITQKLYVFTANGNRVVQAQGSPYSIPNAESLAIASF
jgi:hypothetical protein